MWPAQRTGGQWGQELISTRDSPTAVCFLDMAGGAMAITILEEISKQEISCCCSMCSPWTERIYHHLNESVRHPHLCHSGYYLHIHHFPHYGH